MEKGREVTLVSNGIRGDKRMTIDEAIKHAEEVAEEKEIDAENQNPLFPNDIEECKKCAKNYRQLAEWLKELKQLREQTRWIPVSEGLPEKDGGYWVTVKQGYATTAIWVGNAKNWSKVTAWMSLPKSYKVESEDKNADSGN